MLHRLGALPRPGPAGLPHIVCHGPLHGAPHPPYWPHLYVLLYLAEFVEQFRNASQPLRGPLVVPILKYQLHHLRVPSADCLLQDWGHWAAEGSSLDGSRPGHSLPHTTTTTPHCQPQGSPFALCSTCPALAALFAHVGIVSKEDSHGLQVPQGHGQLQGGAPPGVFLFDVVLGEMRHSAQGK